jgi:diacylglycerol kinase (ATP)
MLALAVISVAGFVFKISNTEWCMQLLAAGLVIAMEVANTALEKLCDYVQPEREKRIGIIKDIAAAGVLWAALTALFIAGLIYIPKF